jgi:pyrroloquinoline quinone biosynthesis protein D
MPLSATARPSLARGCRLSESSASEGMLMLPERAMKLNGPGLEIVRRCDGTRTVAAIVAELQGLYPTAPPQTIEQEATQFLERLWERRAVDLQA